jgi:lipid-binding SYLF domain-containing protein
LALPLLASLKEVVMRATLTALTLAVASTFALLSVSVTSATSSSSLEDEVLRGATQVLMRAVDPQAPAIPPSVMARAIVVAVVPAAQKDGALYYGIGVLSARGGAFELWTPPAVFEFQGAIPLELEAETVDFVLIARTRRGLDYFAAPRFRGPLFEQLAAGPLGRDPRIPADADIVAYMHFGNYFAGVAINDWEFSERRASHERLYGQPYATEDILRGAGFFSIAEISADVA